MDPGGGSLAGVLQIQLSQLPWTFLPSSREWDANRSQPIRCVRDHTGNGVRKSGAAVCETPCASPTAPRKGYLLSLETLAGTLAPAPGTAVLSCAGSRNWTFRVLVRSGGGEGEDATNRNKVLLRDTRT